MGGCYFCGKSGRAGLDFKQNFTVSSAGDNKGLKDVMISGYLGINEDELVMPDGLCKDCLAIVFDRVAQELRKMSEVDFRSV